MRQKEHDKVFLFLYDNKNKVTDFLHCLAHFILHKKFKKSRNEGKKIESTYI